MFIQLLFLASLRKLYASPIDPNRSLFKDTDSFLRTRDTSTGASDSLRTMYGIVWSCLVTILACVWNAVHPNIPGPFDGRWTNLKRRMSTMFCALIAPEIMVMWALRQHFEAKKIVKSYNEKIVLQASPALDQSAKRGIVGEWFGLAKKAIYVLFANLPHDIAVRRKPRLVRSFEPVANVDEEPWMMMESFLKCMIQSWEPLSDREPWTMTHAFFVQMGGFMLYEDENPKEVLGFNHMCYLIGTRQIAAPTVTEAELKDRSKGNALSKCVIVLQTSWFVVQCLARLASQLPLSELEVVTLAFAVMNGIVYWLWWDKPQGVDTAIPIHLQFPDCHGSDPTEAVANHDALNPAPSGLNSQEPSETGSTPSQEKSGTDAQVNKALQLLSETMEDTRSQETSAAVPRVLQDAPPSKEFFKTHRGMTESPPLFYPQHKTESSTDRFSFTTTYSISPWYPVKSFVKKLLKIVKYPLAQLSNMLSDDQLPYGAMNVPIFYSYELDNDHHFFLAIAACVIGALFGAVHFFAWASVFPSPAEQIVWHVSVLITTAGPPLLLLPGFILSKGWLGNIFEQFTGFLMIVISVAYVLGRIALLTVALLSLRALQYDVFIQISWTTFIPHL